MNINPNGIEFLDDHDTMETDPECRPLRCDWCGRYVEILFASAGLMVCDTCERGITDNAK